MRPLRHEVSQNPVEEVNKTPTFVEEVLRKISLQLRETEQEIIKE